MSGGIGRREYATNLMNGTDMTTVLLYWCQRCKMPLGQGYACPHCKTSDYVWGPCRTSLDGPPCS